MKPRIELEATSERMVMTIGETRHRIDWDLVEPMIDVLEGMHYEWEQYRAVSLVNVGDNVVMDWCPDGHCIMTREEAEHLAEGARRMLESYRKWKEANP